MSRNNSIVYQVLQAFNAIKQTGESKHAAKESFKVSRGEVSKSDRAIDKFMSGFAKSTGIYSDQTFKDYLSKSINFAKFCKSEFGIKDISQINSEHVKAYFANNKKRGNQSAIEKFETALTAKYGKQFDLRVSEAVADKPRVFKERAGTHGYSDKNALLAHINNSNIKDTYKLIINIAAETGARAHKILTESGIKINEKGNLYISGKGGRIHNLKLSDNLKNRIVSYIETVNDLKIGDKEYKKALSELKVAAKATGQQYEGFHGFKHNLAAEIRDDIQGQGKSFKESIHDKRYIQSLEHNREVSAYRRG